MRVLLTAAALLLVALPAAGSAAAPPNSARLSISVWPEGRGDGKPVRTLTLNCRPAGGSHPTPARACRRLLANLGALRAVPPKQACLGRYGGPQQAIVSGRVNGRRVRAFFNRRNGCEIARWDRLAPLFRAQANSATSLQITVWPQGTRGSSYATSLTCEPAGGSHPTPTKACTHLRTLEDPFGPLRLDLPCRLVSYGPQVAVVRGSYRGKPVESRFDRSDSCDARRWDRVAILFAAP